MKIIKHQVPAEKHRFNVVKEVILNKQNIESSAFSSIMYLTYITSKSVHSNKSKPNRPQNFSEKNNCKKILHYNQIHSKGANDTMARYSFIHPGNEVVVPKTLHNAGLDGVLLSFVIQGPVSHFPMTGRLEKSVELDQKITFVWCCKLEAKNPEAFINPRFDFSQEGPFHSIDVQSMWHSPKYHGIKPHFEIHVVDSLPTIAGWSVYVDFGRETMSLNYLLEVSFAKCFELLNVASSCPIVHRWLGSRSVAGYLETSSVESIGLVVLHSYFSIKLLVIAQMVQKEEVILLGLDECWLEKKNSGLTCLKYWDTEGCWCSDVWGWEAFYNPIFQGLTLRFTWMVNSRDQPAPLPHHPHIIEILDAFTPPSTACSTHDTTYQTDRRIRAAST